jgi:hypothetical protein
VTLFLCCPFGPISVVQILCCSPPVITYWYRRVQSCVPGHVWVGERFGSIAFILHACKLLKKAMIYYKTSIFLRIRTLHIQDINQIPV